MTRPGGAQARSEPPAQPNRRQRDPERAVRLLGQSWLRAAGVVVELRGDQNAFLRAVTQVIVLTSFHDDQHILPAIRAGALSCLLKDVDPDQLADAIRRAARGEVVFHPRVAAQVMAAFRDDKAGDSHRLAQLTAREFGVLRLIADGRTNAEIGAQFFISEKTVKWHVSNVLGKLHLTDRTKAAAYARRSGLMRDGRG